MNQLPENLTVPYLAKKHGRPIYLAPFLIPSFLIRTNLYYDEICKFLDRFVKHGRELGNDMRHFLDGGYWSKQTLKNTLQPIIRKKNGKYELPLPEEAEEKIGEYINELWLDQIIERILEEVQRHIFLQLTVTDNTAYHNNKTTHWGLHFLNPKNNTLGDLLHHKPTVIYHFPEWQKPGAGNPPIMKIRARNSGLIKCAFDREIVRRILSRIPRKYHKYLGFEGGNEVAARITWTGIQDKMLRGEGVPRKLKGSKQTHPRRLVSYGKPNKGDMWQKYRWKCESFNYAVHSVGSAKDIQFVIDEWKKTWPPDDPYGRKPIRAKFLPSCDGGNFPKPQEVKKMIKLSLNTGNYGLELIEGLWKGVALSDINIKPGKALMRAFKKWAGLI